MHSDTMLSTIVANNTILMANESPLQFSVTPYGQPMNELSAHPTY